MEDPIIISGLYFPTKEPREPDVNIESNVLRFYNCPECSCSLDYKQNECGYCHQAIDWSKEAEHKMMVVSRDECQMRAENGNCLPVGGFCTAVSDIYCEIAHRAYDKGYLHGISKTKDDGDEHE